MKFGNHCIKVIKSRRMNRAGHIALMGDVRNTKVKANVVLVFETDHYAMTAY
jgi:hypothetical protein